LQRSVAPVRSSAIQPRIGWFIESVSVCASSQRPYLLNSNPYHDQLCGWATKRALAAQKHGPRILPNLPADQAGVNHASLGIQATPTGNRINHNRYNHRCFNNLGYLRSLRSKADVSINLATQYCDKVSSTFRRIRSSTKQPITVVQVSGFGTPGNNAQMQGKMNVLRPRECCAGPCCHRTIGHQN